MIRPGGSSLSCQTLHRHLGYLLSVGFRQSSMLLLVFNGAPVEGSNRHMYPSPENETYRRAGYRVRYAFFNTNSSAGATASDV